MAPCFLVCVIGSDCSLFRDLPYNYRAFARGIFCPYAATGRNETT